MCITTLIPESLQPTRICCSPSNQLPSPSCGSNSPVERREETEGARGHVAERHISDVLAVPGQKATSPASSLQRSMSAESEDCLLKPDNARWQLCIRVMCWMSPELQVKFNCLLSPQASIPSFSSPLLGLPTCHLWPCLLGQGQVLRTLMILPEPLCC